MANPTVGFKCSNELKNQLQQEAIDMDMTLSQYINQICENRMEGYRVEGDFEDKFKQEQDKCAMLELQLYEYETVYLGDLFTKHQGKRIKLIGPKGEEREYDIEEPIDILIALIESIQ